VRICLTALSAGLGTTKLAVQKVDGSPFCQAKEPCPQ
jgi:hypothetical protein